MGMLFSSAMQGEQEVSVLVKNDDGIEQLHFIRFSEDDSQSPKKLVKRLGLKPWTPKLEAILGKIVDNSPAKTAGLQAGDLIISADGEQIADWMQWVEYVRSRPSVSIQIIIERKGVHIPLTITPETIETEEKDYGRIGAAVEVPEALIKSMRVEYSLSPVDALGAAIERTWFYSTSTLKMMGNMVIGKASVENLSGPISIAQYAGQSAEMGLVSFLKFLALISVSLGVLNLLPIPVLDGGHLMFFLIEAIKGSPVTEQIQIAFQNMGLVMLMSLMIFAVFLDIERLFQ